MKPTLWRRIESLLSQSLELSPSRRGKFLKKATAGDDELRIEIESLLNEEDTGKFLETSALEVAGGLLARSRLELTDTALGPYNVGSLLGAGGNAVVYKARHRELMVDRAIKILPPEIARDSTRMRRFFREARTAGKLDHPNIAKVHEVGDVDGIYYIALEYVPGETLAERIKSRQMTVPDLVEVGSQVGAALQYAHSKRVIHRDIKSSNIMIGPQRRLKVLDFGLAKMSRSEDDPEESLSSDTLTRSGVVMGTVSFMSPEQLLGYRDLDGRTDIYSLGVVLYNIATGQLPFTGRTVPEQMDRILNARPEAIARFNPYIPEDLEKIIARCLEKERKARYRSCRNLLADLSRVQTRA
jgi:serine/threonine protein kinase